MTASHSMFSTGTHYVDKADLEFEANLLPYLPECLDDANELLYQT